MTPDQKRREAAEKFAMSAGYLDTEEYYTTAFLAGCKYEAKEAEARGFQRAVELLRGLAYGDTQRFWIENAIERLEKQK